MVHAILVLNRCPPATAANQHATTAMLLRWYRAARVHAVDSHVIDSPSMAYGWIAAYKIAYRVLQSRGVDFMLQVRHDVALERPITQWPANFSRLSFERQCIDCDEGCACNSRAYLLSKRQQPQCKLCAADHLIWAPRRFIAPLYRSIVEHGVVGHDLLGHLLTHEAAAVNASTDIGYLFPIACVDFPIAILCSEIGAYRPVRLDRDTMAPPVKLKGTPEWSAWEQAYGFSQHGGMHRWRARVREMWSTPHAGLRVDWF